MIKKGRSALIVTILVSLLILLISYLEMLSMIWGYSLLLGIACSTLNFLLFLGAYSFSIKKSNKTFLLYTIGGIGVRLLIMLSLVVISIKFLKVDLLGFIFALFIWYIFFMIFEISIVRQSLGGRSD